MTDPAATDLVDAPPADRHRAVAATFTTIVVATTDWDRPSPVDGWAAHDVVEHLLTWFPEFLSAAGVDLPAAPPDDDLVARWQAQTTAIQALLDDPSTAASEITHPMAGTHALADAVDRFYTSDVVMHTWDLARAAGVDAPLDPAFAAHLLAGLEPMADVLRSSGHYGPPVAVAADADPVRRLVAFIGRDPDWQPPA